MENTTQSILYNLLVTKDFDPEILDINGREISDPDEADMFSFDFVVGDKNYGTVVLMLGNDQDLQVYYSDNISKNIDSEDKKKWFSFLKQLKNFAVRNMLSFDLRNLNKLKYNMKSMAAINEGYYGNRHVSYSDQPKKTRLIIKHSRALGEGEARYRAVESLFVETDEGERFKLPFTKLSGGRAMARHISEGGRPYDAFGKHICEMIKEMTILNRFARSVRNKNLDDNAAELAEEAIRHYGQLKSKVKRIISKRGYAEEIGNFSPDASSETGNVESLRDMFIEQSLDSRIEEALPVLAKLSEKKKSCMAEADEFATWAESIAETDWTKPNQSNELKKLEQALSSEVPVGVDAINATEIFYDLFSDKQLFDQLYQLSQKDPGADSRPLVLNRLKELGYDVSNLSIDEDLDTDGVMATRPSNMSSESIERLRYLSRIE